MTNTSTSTESATKTPEIEVKEQVDQPKAFGRLRWWFEESPMAVTASMALTLVSIGFLFILTARSLHADMPMTSVALQAVQADSTASDTSQAVENALEIQQLSADSAADRPEEKMELPELPRQELKLNPNELLGNQADSDKELKETDAALRQAGDMLRKILEANQNRGQGTGKADGAGGQGVGQLDPHSTPGRQARWIITYPTIPQSDYERMLDSFRIELAFLQSDRRTMQYVAGLSGAGKTYTGQADREDRMFWYWMGQNRLKEVDDAVLRRHGQAPTSDVVHLYPKDLEKKLAELEKDYLRRQFKQNNVERVAQTNFKIVSGPPGGWHLEVTGMVLR